MSVGFSSLWQIMLWQLSSREAGGETFGCVLASGRLPLTFVPVEGRLEAEHAGHGVRRQVVQLVLEVHPVVGRSRRRLVMMVVVVMVGCGGRVRSRVVHVGCGRRVGKVVVQGLVVRGRGRETGVVGQGHRVHQVGLVQHAAGSGCYGATSAAATTASRSGQIRGEQLEGHW
uniref:(northern house mosquito) hypothetical protein n=1 Tax=Culex pipiens TaxID=7175 RepID=A0A8D8GAH5_CULPI